MGRSLRSARTLLRTLCTIGVTVAVLIASSPWVAQGRSDSPITVGLSTPTPQQLGPRSATLHVDNLTVAPGFRVYISLYVTAVNCGAGAPPNETVAKVVFQLGDGFTFQEPGVSGGSSCTQGPWSESIPLVYAYRTTGSKNITASVTWGDGLTVESNTVAVNVTGAPPTTVPLLQTWLWETIVGAGAAMVVWLVLRRLLPESPFLSVKKV